MRWSLLLFLLPAILLFLGFFHTITAYNQDLARHLKTGEIIVKTLHVPTTNLFSYTYPNFPFINHHWGSEVVFYLVKTVSGDPGLFILSLVLIFSTCSLIFWQALKKGSVVMATILALIYVPIQLERTDIRPELFSFLFLSLIVTILYRYREKTTKLIFLIPLLELLWTNMHIYFPIGVLVMLLFVIDELVTKRKNLMNNHTKLLVGVFILTGLMTLLNPHFLTGALYPLHVFQNYGYTIEENQNPFFLQSIGYPKASFPYLELAIGILFTSLVIILKKSRLIDWLLAITFTIVALNAVRNFPLFVFATFVPAVTAATLATTRLRTFIKAKPPIWQIVGIACLIGVFVWQIQTAHHASTFGYGVDAGAEKALDFYQANNLKGPIFNNFDIGSYIEARLYPKEKVFIDGRPEAYPASFIQNVYIKMQQDPALFTKVASRYHFTTIIFSHTDQTPWAESFLTAIIRNPDWSTIYLDPMMIILVKKTPQNQALIQKYGMTPEQLSASLPNDETQLRQLAHFYSIANLPKQLEETLLKLTAINPSDCSILGTLAQLYSQQNNPAATIYVSRYQLQCSK